MHLVCPSCTAINRVPEERLHDKPTCGKCKHEIAPGRPVNLGDANLPRYLEKTEVPVLVDFWAEWCGPCKMYGPQFEKLAGERSDIRFVKVNSDAAQATSLKHGVRSIPTTILFNRGREVGRVSGALSAAQLQHWLDGKLSER